MAISTWYPTGGNTRPAVSASPWDVLTFGGAVLSGRARITQASAAWKIDAKKAKGKDADRATAFGFDSRPIGFEVSVENADEMNRVNQALAPHIPRPGADFKPVPISHAQIDHLVGVKAMYVDSVSEWKRSGGTMTITVTGRVWVATEKPPAKKKKSKVATPTTTTENERREDAKRRGQVGGQNTPPSEQPNFCGPAFASVP